MLGSRSRSSTKVLYNFYLIVCVRYDTYFATIPALVLMMAVKHHCVSLDHDHASVEKGAYLGVVSVLHPVDVHIGNFPIL